MSPPQLYLKQLEVGPMANFVYLVGDAATREVVVVDPAWQVDTILKTCEQEGLTLRGALISHGHFDHASGIEELLAREDVPVYVQKEEAEFVGSLGPNAPELFTPFPKENTRTVASGDKLRVGGVELTFVHTPGHTPGSQCFLVEKSLISGDTLFIRGCGRCDLPGGDPRRMYESLTQKLLKMPDDTLLYPGHNYAGDASVSRMEDEKKKNPYLICRDLRTFLMLTGAPGEGL